MICILKFSEITPRANTDILWSIEFYLKCSSNNADHNSALVFSKRIGARYVTTRDFDVDEHTVVQFEVRHEL